MGSVRGFPAADPNRPEDTALLLNAVKTKSRSTRGASITFALLLFMVCAVLGAVVLTAGTASAGRVSGMAEADGRYYSVSSAAELLTQELTGRSVTITRVRTVATSTDTVCVDRKFVVNENGVDLEQWISDPPDVQTPVTGDPTYAITVREGDGTDLALPQASLPFLSAQAVQLMFGSSNLSTPAEQEAAMSCSLSAGFSHAEIPFTLTHATSASGVTAADLAIDGSVEMRGDGTLIFLLKDVDGGFWLRLTLTPSVEESTKSILVPTDSVTGPVTSAAGDTVTTTFTHTDTVTTTKTSTITWSVGELQKVVR